MKIAISGSSGFLGRSIIRNLKEFEIIPINRNKINIEKRTDIVLHLAGIAHDMSAKYTYQDYIKSNFQLTKKLYKKFIDSNASVFIFVSTSKVYGERGIFNEKSAVNPQTFYAKSKLKAENYLLKKINTDFKNIIILRPSLIYSNQGKMKGNLNSLRKFISRIPVVIFPNIEQKRSYCSIENFYDLIRFFQLSRLESGVYNFCDSNSLSTYSIVKKLSRNKIFISLNKNLSLILFKISLKTPLINKIAEKIFNEFILENDKIKINTGLKLEKTINL